MEKNDSWDAIATLMEEFAAACEPLESGEKLLRLIDERTGAHYCECHIRGSKLIAYGTTNVPLDPDEPDYRANREIVEDDVAFERMKDDAKKKTIVQQHRYGMDKGTRCRTSIEDHRRPAPV